MDSIIRKISIGADYKNEAMHYSVKQTVYGGHEISHILFEESDNSYNIFIKKVDFSTNNNDKLRGGDYRVY